MRNPEDSLYVSLILMGNVTAREFQKKDRHTNKKDLTVRGHWQFGLSRCQFVNMHRTTPIAEILILNLDVGQIAEHQSSATVATTIVKRTNPRERGSHKLYNCTVSMHRVSCTLVTGP